MFRSSRLPQKSSSRPASALVLLVSFLAVFATAAHAREQARSEARVEAGGWPPGLSAEARRTIQAYEERLLEAGRRSEIEPRKMPGEFIGKVAVEIARETLATNWPAVREYADRALAALPAVTVDGLEMREAVSVFPPPEIQEEYDRAMALLATRELSLAAARTWEPARVARTAASQILGSALTPQDYARNSILSGLVSEGLARTTWQGAEALVTAQGAWIVVLTYLRTPKGLIFARRSWLFPRDGVGADSFR